MTQTSGSWIIRIVFWRSWNRTPTSMKSGKKVSGKNGFVESSFPQLNWSG